MRSLSAAPVEMTAGGVLHKLTNLYHKRGEATSGRVHFQGTKFNQA